MVAEIMKAAGFGEVCFLVAFVLFVIEFITRLTMARRAEWHYGWLLGVAGLAFIALGWLALPTGP
jgi:cell division protein FtsX